MKIKDITPSRFSCAGGACPAVYDTDRGTYLIIGRKVEVPEGIPHGKIGLGKRSPQQTSPSCPEKKGKKSVKKYLLCNVTHVSQIVASVRIQAESGFR